MISLIIVFYNYFVWLFTNNMPMEHLNKELNPMTIFLFGSLEFLVEYAIIMGIIFLIRYIKGDL